MKTTDVVISSHTDEDPGPRGAGTCPVRRSGLSGHRQGWRIDAGCPGFFSPPMTVVYLQSGSLGWVLRVTLVLVSNVATLNWLPLLLRERKMYVKWKVCEIWGKGRGKRKAVLRSGSHVDSLYEILQFTGPSKDHGFHICNEKISS